MLFARFSGKLDWICPKCNRICSTYIRAINLARIHCTHCKALYYHGLVLYKAPKGPRIVPRDTLMIGGGFTNKRLVNKTYCENCCAEISETVKARMVEDIQSPELDPTIKALQ